MMGKMVWVGWVLATVATQAAADVVWFQSGDRLTGTLVRIDGGKMTFESAEVGKVTIDMARVTRFATEAPVSVHLTDGSVLETAVGSDQPGQLQLLGSDALAAQTIDLASLAAVNPPGPPPVKWKGNLTAGFSTSRGNTNSDSASASFSATRRSEQDRTWLYGTYLVGQSEDPATKEKRTTEESLVLGGQYDYFLSEKMYVFGNARYKTDHIADLDHRVLAGLGLGYQWIESEKLNFSTDAGYAHVCEQYTTYDPALGRERTTSNDEPSLQLGYHFDWAVNHWLSFIHNTRYYPSFGGLQDYFLTSDAEFRASLTEQLFTSFKAVLDYDSTPAEGTEETDTKYILGVGYTF